MLKSRERGCVRITYWEDEEIQMWGKQEPRRQQPRTTQLGQNRLGE